MATKTTSAARTKAGKLPADTTSAAASKAGRLSPYSREIKRVERGGDVGVSALALPKPTGEENAAVELPKAASANEARNEFSSFVNTQKFIKNAADRYTAQTHDTVREPNSYGAYMLGDSKIVDTGRIPAGNPQAGINRAQREIERIKSGDQNGNKLHDTISEIAGGFGRGLNRAAQGYVYSMGALGQKVGDALGMTDYANDVKEKQDRWASALQNTTYGKQAARLDELNNQIVQYKEMAAENATRNEMREAMNNSDFTTYAKYNPNLGNDKDFDYLYEQVNQSKRWQNKENYLNSYNTAAITDPNSQAMRDSSHALAELTRDDAYSYLDPEQIAVFNYYYNKGEKDKALDFLNTIKPSLDKKRWKADSAKYQQMGHDMPITSSAASVLAAPAAGVGAIAQGIESIANGYINPYSRFNILNDISQNVRAGTRSKIEETIPNKVVTTVATLGYDVVMSMLESRMRAGMNVAGIGDLGLGSMALGVAQSVTNEKIRQGHSEADALTIGVVNGLAEYWTERAGMERLTEAMQMPKELGKKTIRELFKEFLPSMGKAAFKYGVPEMAEEGLADIIDFTVDTMVSIDRSEWGRRTKELQKEYNLSESDARSQALMEQWKELGLDSVAGFFSGALGGDIETALQYGTTASVKGAEAVMNRSADRAQRRADREAAKISGEVENASAMSAEQWEASRKDQSAEAKNRRAAIRVSGERHGIDENTIREVQAASDRTGRNIAWTVLPYDEYGAMNGFFDEPDTKNIYINTKANKPLQWVLLHEFGHTIENSKEFNSLAKLAVRSMYQQGMDVPREVQKIAALYKKKKAKGANPAYELIMNWFGDNMGDSAKDIERLCNYDHGLGMRVWNYINEQLTAALGYDDQYQAAMLNRAKELYGRALNNTSTNDQQKWQLTEEPDYVAPIDESEQQNTQAPRERSAEEVDEEFENVVSDIITQYASEQITYEQYNAALDAAEQKYGYNVKDAGKLAKAKRTNDAYQSEVDAVIDDLDSGKIDIDTFNDRISSLENKYGFPVSELKPRKAAETEQAPTAQETPAAQETPTKAEAPAEQAPAPVKAETQTEEKAPAKRQITPQAGPPTAEMKMAKSREPESYRQERASLGEQLRNGDIDAEEYGDRTDRLDDEYGRDVVADAEDAAAAYNVDENGEREYSYSTDLDRLYPGWNDNSTTSSGRDNTQIAGTISTYRRIGQYLEQTDPDARILDASSGLGLGTQDLKARGFDIDDVEPFPSDDRRNNANGAVAPTYTDYADIPEGSYDVVISNAVLNVIPDDWRNDVVDKMAKAVAPGGKLIVNVRDAAEVAKTPSRIPLENDSEILVTQNGKPRHYQKGFTQSELENYLRDRLGDGWTVDKAKPSNSGLPSGSRAVVAVKDKDTGTAHEGGIDISNDTKSAYKYSYTTWNKSDYVQKRDEAAEELAENVLGEATDENIAIAKKWIDDVNGIASVIADDRNRLDYVASPGRSSFKSNAEYGGSIDSSTICAKRRLLTGTIDAIQTALGDEVLSEEDYLAIRNMMKREGHEVSCGLCYVESTRKNIAKYASQFLEEWNAEHPDNILHMTDVNTVFGLEDTRLNNSEAYDAYVSFMNKLAQRKPKLFEMRAEYDNDILKKFRNDDSVEAKNHNGGLRINSFSDFEIVHLIDMMQVITDMANVGLNGQAYTKVREFAEALGGTGLKINMSMICGGVDENGRIIFDEVEGMKWSDVEDLRDRYPDNVGTILVTFTDEQLKAALNDDRIDYIIPFHRSQWSKKDYALLGIPANAKDATPQQNERYIEPVYRINKNGKPVKMRPDNYMPNNYWRFDLSGKKNAENYLRMCAENNRRPKFYKLLVNNGDGSYSLQPDGSTDGYWKLLIDFKMYNHLTGEGAEQKPVRPIFDMDACQRMLNNYKGGHQSFPVAQDIVDSFVKEYKGRGKAKYKNGKYTLEGGKFSYTSNVTPEENEEYLRAARAGDTETAQRMVDEAAVNAGYILAVPDRKYSISQEKLDEYDEAFNEGNEDWMEQVALEAATENGYRMSGLHGSPISDIKVFNTHSQETKKQKLQLLFGTHFTWVRQYAELYTHKAKNSKGTSHLTRKAGKVYHCALDLGKSLDLKSSEQYQSGSEMWDLYQDLPANIKKKHKPETYSEYDTQQGLGEGEYINARIMEDALQDMSPFDAEKFLRDHNYNSVLYIARYFNGMPGIYSKDPSIIMLDENRIKSVDPITYDDDGKIIPLSERFNRKKNDIRYSITPAENAEYMEAAEAGDEETAGRMVADAARRAGYDSPMLYHGTQSFGFTKFDPAKSDDGISLFATSDSKIAQTYSSRDGIRRVNTPKNLDTPEQIVAALKETPLLWDAQYFPADAIDKKADFADMILDRLIKQLNERAYFDAADDNAEEIRKAAGMFKRSTGTENVKQAAKDLYGAIKNAGLYRRDDIVYDTSMELSNAIDLLQCDWDAYWYLGNYHNREAAIRTLNKNGAYSGNYALYGRTDGMLEIDGGGENWNRVPISGDISKALSGKRTATTREIARYGKDNGYMGVLIRNITDNGGIGKDTGAGDVYIYFDGISLKSADPITYDDNGEIIPLNERFNPEEEDIRYSYTENEPQPEQDTKLRPMTAVEQADRRLRNAQFNAKVSERQAAADNIRLTAAERREMFGSPNSVGKVNTYATAKVAEAEGRGKQIIANSRDVGRAYENVGRAKGAEREREGRQNKLKLERAGRENKKQLEKEGRAEKRRIIKEGAPALDQMAKEKYAKAKERGYAAGYESGTKKANREYTQLVKQYEREMIEAEDRENAHVQLWEKARNQEYKPIESAADAVDMYNALKAARRAYRRISDYNELTPRERMFVGRLLRDEEDAATLFREKDIRYLKVLSEATAVYNYSKLGSMLGEYRGKIHTEANKTALDAIGGSENFRKMRDVPQKLLASAMTTGRVFDYIAGNDYEMAERLKDAYVKPITRSNGAEERLKQRVKDRISALNIDKSIRKGNKVSEDYAVQFIGEKMSEIEALEDKESKWRKQHDSAISDIRSQLDGGVQKNGRPLTEKMRQNLEERLNNHESKEMPEYKNEAGQTLEELRAEVEAFKDANRNLDYNRIENDLVPVFREIYNDLFEKMNEARVANGYEPVDYRRGYFPHFTREDTSAMVRFAKSLGMEFDNKVLPTSIQGLTHEFRPGINWFSAAQERTGTNTDFSAQEGMDRYLEGVAKVIYRTENITKMRALANTIRRLADPKFDRFIKDVYSDKTKSEEEKYAAVEQKWRNELSDDKKAQRQALSYFVTWLDERTNIYAGKATNFDRLLRENLQVRTDKGLWKLLGFATDLPRGMVTRYGGNTVSINPGSWLTNFAPIFEVSAEVNPKYVLQALGSLKKDLREGFTEESNFLTARSGTDPLFTVADIGRTQMNHQGALKWLEGLGNVMKGAVNWGAKPMELIDGVTSYVVTRAYYLSNLDKGMSHDAALDLADNQAGDLMADRAPGKLPILMEIKNPIAKGFTQFQTEVLNSLEHNTHDVFGEIRKRYADDPKRGRAVIKSILRYMGFALRKSILLWLCNELYEALVGRRFMPDPIDWANEFRGDLTGNQLPNTVNLGINAGLAAASGGKVGRLPTAEDFMVKAEPGKAVANLGKNVAEELPIVGSMLGGGRIPVQQAVKDIDKLPKGIALLTDDDKENNESGWANLIKGLSGPLTYFVLPGGGTAVRRAVQAAEQYVQGGAFDVNGNLRYPLYNDNTLELVTNVAKVGLFGSTSSEAGQKWVDSGFDSFSKDATAAYIALTELGIDRRKAYGVVNKMRDVTKSEDESENTRRRAFIREQDIDGRAKAALYETMVLSDTAKARDVIDTLDIMGADMDKAMDLILGLADIDAKSYTAPDDSSKAAEKRKLLNSSRLDGDSKLEVYSNLILTSNAAKERDLISRVKEFCDDGELVKVLTGLKESGKTVDDTRVLVESSLPDDVKEEVYKTMCVNADQVEKKESQIDAFREAGMGFNEYITAANKYAEINAQEDLKPVQKATEFARWADDNLGSGSSAAKENLKYSSGFSVEASGYEKMTDTGLSSDKAYDLTNQIAALTPKEGKTTVSDVQKAQVVASQADLSEEEKLKALRAVYSESENSTYSKAYVANMYGVPLEDYFKIVDKCLEVDADPKYKDYKAQERTAAVLNSFKSLTNKQRAAIWQVYNTGWVAKNNPYDSSVGAYVRSLYYEADGKTKKDTLPGGLSRSGSSSASAELTPPKATASSSSSAQASTQAPAKSSSGSSGGGIASGLMAALAPPRG